LILAVITWSQCGPPPETIEARDPYSRIRSPGGRLLAVRGRTERLDLEQGWPVRYRSDTESCTYSWEGTHRDPVSFDPVRFGPTSERAEPHHALQRLPQRAPFEGLVTAQCELSDGSSYTRICNYRTGLLRRCQGPAEESPVLYGYHEDGTLEWVETDEYTEHHRYRWGRWAGFETEYTCDYCMYTPEADHRIDYDWSGRIAGIRVYSNDDEGETARHFYSVQWK
jgi:hypothetical protein